MAILLTNCPITSREYKLMLNCERFRDRHAGAELFWKLMTFLIENQGNSIIPNADDPDKDVEKQRDTWFIDTPRHELLSENLILRVREEPKAKKRFKVTLKSRSSDRYIAANCDLRCTQKVEEKEIKFEEDVTPPFVSKFSKSVSLKSDELPRLETIADLCVLFPGLPQDNLIGTSPLKMVNDFRAYERQHFLGKLKLGHLLTGSTLEDSAIVIKMALTHWYFRPDENDYPLMTEFSFGCNAHPTAGRADLLEQFPALMIVGANRLFRDLQSQIGWMAPLGSTKTAYVFSIV